MATIEVILKGETKSLTKSELFVLAEQGTIQPETSIVVDGKLVTAKKIKGLVFGESPKTKGSEPDIFGFADLNLVSQSVPTSFETEEWFYEDESDRGGPITQSVLIKLIQAGSLNGDAKVWKKYEKVQFLRNIPTLAGFIIQKTNSLHPVPVSATTRATSSKRQVTSDKNKYVAALLAILFGPCGAHWLYLGRTGRFLLYLFLNIGGLLFFFGIPTLILWMVILIEFIYFLVVSQETFEQYF